MAGADEDFREGSSRPYGGPGSLRRPLTAPITAGGAGSAHGMFWPLPQAPEDKEVLIESRWVDSCGDNNPEKRDVVVFEQTDLYSLAFPVMSDLRRNDLLCDVTIRLAGQDSESNFDWSFRAHRVVLAATFPYFHAMFTHDMLESRQDTITIGACGVEPSALEALLNFSYTGKLVIDGANVRSLMLSASFLQLSRVIDACAEYLIARLTPNNALENEDFAESLGCSLLSSACQKFIKKYFVHIVNSTGKQFMKCTILMFLRILFCLEYMQLSLEKMITLTSEDELEVTSEEVVFNAVLAWVKYDPELRAEALPKLLSCVRMPLLTPQFLSDKVAPEPLVRSNMECRDLLDAARDFHLMPERRSLLQGLQDKAKMLQGNCRSYLCGWRANQVWKFSEHR